MRCAEELEDLAFRELNPEAYTVISERLDALETKNVGLVTEIEQQLTRKLVDRGIDAEVTGRRKRAYSIWRKMERKSVGFEQLSDIFGFRVIVKSLPEKPRTLRARKGSSASFSIFSLESGGASCCPTADII